MLLTLAACAGEKTPAGSGLFANGQGICLGSGQIWLLDPSYASDAEPALEIIAISGVTKDS